MALTYRCHSKLCGWLFQFVFYNQNCAIHDERKHLGQCLSILVLEAPWPACSRHVQMNGSLLGFRRTWLRTDIRTAQQCTAANCVHFRRTFTLYSAFLVRYYSKSFTTLEHTRTYMHHHTLIADAAMQGADLLIRRDTALHVQRSAWHFFTRPFTHPLTH